MDKALFTKETSCPVCMEKISVVKVKNSSVRVVKKDEDFCPYYEPINALLYDAWICPKCGYAALEDKFPGITDKEIKTIKQTIKSKWTPRSFPEERDLKAGLEAYKLALLNAQIRQAKSSELARICMRIAWLYRFIGDEREKEFLKFALDAYLNVFEKEGLPADNLDEVTCMYLIGAVNMKLGNINESAKWLHKVISIKDGDQKTRTLINSARDLVQSLKENKGDVEQAQ